MPRVRLVDAEVAGKIFEKAQKEKLDSGEIQELFADLPNGEEITWSMISRWRREWEQGKAPAAPSAPVAGELDELLGLGGGAPAAPVKTPKTPRKTVMQGVPGSKPAKKSANPVPTPAKTAGVATGPITWRAMSWLTADCEVLCFAVPEVWACFVEERLQALAGLFQS